MMTKNTRALQFWFSIAAASLISLPACPAGAQSAPANPVQAPVQPASETIAPSTEATVTPADRATAYYHVALANIDVEEAVSQGRTELYTRAIEEYKLAINADPGSPLLNDGLAELYFTIGRAHDAEV
ncbi:MAG: hypothetical protein ABSG51_14780, partial [Terracidiphilus sp.]